MDSPERSRSYGKREAERNSDVKVDRDGDDEGWEGSDKRKHRSNKPRRPNIEEEAEGLDGSGRRRGTGEKSDSRKRSSGNSRPGSDEDEYETKRERSKQLKKRNEESSLEKLSSWYQDGEMESKQDGRDRSGHRGHGVADDRERRKPTSKFSDHESSQSRSRGKEEQSRDRERDEIAEKDSRYLDRRESSRERGHESSELARSQRKKWDESDAGKKDDEYSYGRTSDSKRESDRERSLSSRVEPNDGKSRVLDLDSDRGMKTRNREDSRDDVERAKNKGRFGGQEEDYTGSPKSREERIDREKYEKNRQQRTPPGRDSETRERSFTTEEVDNTRVREKGVREAGNRDRSRSPERSGRRHQEAEYSELESERSNNPKPKEVEIDGYRDERSKGRDDSWSDRNRDREGSKDNWKRRQPGNNDKDSHDGDVNYDHGREWEFQRHGRERADNERLHGRTGGRKDANRGEAVKTSSKFGISNENYDVIEIQTKPLDYGRAESVSTVSRSEVGQAIEKNSALNDDDGAYVRDDKATKTDTRGSGQSGNDSKERYTDHGASMRDPNAWRDDIDIQGSKGRGQNSAMSNRAAGGQSSSSGSLPPYGNQEPGSFNRVASQGVKGNRMGRGGRGRPIGRDSQVTIPLPMMGPPFGPPGMPPPGPMQQLTPTMSPGPSMSPGLFIPSFSPPVVWPGARGVDLNMMAVPQGLSPVPSGPSGPRFPSNIGTQQAPALYFNQPGPGMVVPPNFSSPGFNPMVPTGRGQPHEKPSGGWPPPRSGPPGKAPSRGEQNDYSQNFVDTGMRPQNFIRELELTNVVEDYPKLRELIQKKDEIVANSSTSPMYYKCDLREHVLVPEFFGTKFDVILVDPPWEEYVHRAPGVADHMECWTFEEIMNLKIEAIADTPSFIFLWVGDGVGLEQGRQCLKKWGFRRCEDICWVKTNKTNASPGLRHDSHTLFQHSKEHCLMGIKGTVRRSTDGHIIHANIDTDVIIAEEPPYGSTAKPEDMYRIIEHFSLGRRRLELFGEDHNIRSGWLTVGKDLSSSNFNAEAYVRNFADKDGKVWQGGGGRNPPPDAPHLVLTTPDIESLRPKSPMKNQQQQQQSASISIATVNSSSNKRMTGNSPQNTDALILNQQEVSSSNLPAPWGAPSMAIVEGFNGGNMTLDNKVFDMYGYNATLQPSGEYLDFDTFRTNNMM